MLKSVNPLSTILATVWVSVSTLAVFLIKTVISFISSAILPCINTYAVHNTTFKLSLKISSIGPFEDSLAWHFISNPITLISRAIGPKINTLALFNSIAEISKVVASIRPNLNTFTTLLFRTIRLPKDAEPCRFVLLPWTLVNFFAFWSFKYTYAYWLAIKPKAFKRGTIRPLQFAVPAFDKFYSFGAALNILLIVRGLAKIACLSQILDTAIL